MGHLYAVGLGGWHEGYAGAAAFTCSVKVFQVAGAKRPESIETKSDMIRPALLVGVSAETPGAIAWDVSAETFQGQARIAPTHMRAAGNKLIDSWPRSVLNQRLGSRCRGEGRG